MALVSSPKEVPAEVDGQEGFICPSCREPLAAGVEALVCPNCRASFPLVSGPRGGLRIPLFTNLDPFYEGRWAQADLSAGSARNWLVRKERFFLRRLRGQRGRVLDLGCGGGWRLFCRLGPVMGVDLSLTSVRAAATIYPQVAVADLSRLPFPEASFDFVVSLDLLGHIPLQDKDAVLGEIFRVLRPGGRTLHYIEALGDDPLTRFERRYPELYQRHIIEPEGHIGLEPPSAVFARFRRMGFRPVRELSVYRMLLYVSRVIQHLDNEYQTKAWWARASVALGRFLGRWRPVEAAANVGVSALMELGDRLFPAHWAGGVLVEYLR